MTSRGNASGKEPWGGYWGLFDGKQRTIKYPPGGISNYPFWKWQMACGLALSLSVFGAAWLALTRRSTPPRLISWVAVTGSATVGGILLGVSAENMFCQSYGLFGWLGRGLLLAAGIAAPLLCSSALMSGRGLPTFIELIGPRDLRTRSFPTIVLGFTLILTALIAAQTALSLAFDPRWRDFRLPT